MSNLLQEKSCKSWLIPKPPAVAICRWTVREGRAVDVLNTVNKWVEDFVSFDAERVAVVYTQAPKKDAGGPGEQLGMVDLQVGYP
jgi:hypothetical protein